MRALKSGKILTPLLFGTVFLLFGAEAYHYDLDWHVLMFRNRVRMAGLPIRVLCEGEVLLKTRTAKDAKPFACLARQAVAEYKAEGDRYTNNLQTYTSTGDFLNFGLTKGSFPNPDTNGIPRVRYGGKLQYNPVTIAQFALTMYGRYVRGDQAAFDNFLRGARQL